MFQQFKAHIANNFSELSNKKLILAVSGGIDSVVLTHLCHKLGYDLVIAHCNFGIRPEAGQDEIFVTAMANRLEIPIFVKKFNTKQLVAEQPISTQMMAREIRYKWFKELAGQYKLDYILTAHHADDNLETFFINLNRGTGLDGLLGIPEKNGNIVRPLLPFSKEQLKDYAISHHLTWREDSTNEETNYTRNYIRHKVVTPLKEIAPKLLDSFNKTLSHLRESSKLVDVAVETIKKSVCDKKDDLLRINLDALQQISSPNGFLYKLLKPYHFTAWKDIFDLIESQSGKMVYSKTHRIIKDRNELLVTPIPAKETPIYTLPKVGTYHFSKFTISMKEISLQSSTDPKEGTTNPVPPFSEGTRGRPNLEAFQSPGSKPETKIIITNPVPSLSEGVKGRPTLFPLTIRRWEKGDYFYPLGMGGKKKLSKYFKDERFSLLDKENTWLLCSGNDIIWVILHRLDDRFKVAPETRNMLEITFEEK